MAATTPFIAPQATWDLRMARVDRSAAWRARQNAKPRRATARSVSLLALPGPSWGWVPVLSFTSAVFVCGMPRSERVARRVPLFHRHDHTPHPGAANRCLSCLFAAGPWSQQRTRARIATNTLPLLVLKYRRWTVRATLPMNGHRFRGSHHGTTHIDHAMYARDGRLVIQIQSAAGLE